MPKVVDHPQRRREIVETFLRVAERDGLSAATSRNVAAELGTSPGTLWYYFDDTTALISAAHDLIFERVNARIADATEGVHGIAAVLALMAQIVPVERMRPGEAAVVVSFWGRVADNQTVALKHAGAESHWRGLLRGHLEESLETGEMLAGTGIESLVDILITVCFGQQIAWVTRAMLVSDPRPMEVVCAVLRPYVQDPAILGPALASIAD
jgi:AcrR family transcriptional regulator